MGRFWASCSMILANFGSSMQWKPICRNVDSSLFNSFNSFQFSIYLHFWPSYRWVDRNLCIRWWSEWRSRFGYHGTRPQCAGRCTIRHPDFRRWWDEDTERIWRNRPVPGAAGCGYLRQFPNTCPACRSADKMRPWWVRWSKCTYADHAVPTPPSMLPHRPINLPWNDLGACSKTFD